MRRRSPFKPGSENPYGAALLILTFVVLALALAACGGSGSSTSGSTAEAGSAEATTAAATEGEASTGGEAFIAEAEKAVAEAEQVPNEILAAELGPFTPKPGQTVYNIACDKQIEGCRKASEAIEEATKEIGYTYEECDTKLNEPESPSKCFTNALNAKPDAITDIAIGEQEAGNGYAEVEAAGIPVVTIASEREPKNPGEVEVAGPQWTLEQGELIGKFDIAATQGKAKVLVPVVSSIPSLVMRYEGLVKALEACPECEAKKVEFSGSNFPELPKLLQQEMQSNPQYNVISANLNTAGTLAMEAVRNTGRSDVIVTTTDGAEANVEGIRQGEMALDVSFAGREDGWQMIDAVARILAGQDVPSQLETTKVAITQKNIGQFQAPENYFGVPNFKQAYLKLWGIK